MVSDQREYVRTNVTTCVGASKTGPLAQPKRKAKRSIHEVESIFESSCQISDLKTRVLDSYKNSSDKGEVEKAIVDLEAQGLFNDEILSMLRDIRNKVKGDKSITQILQRIIDVFICIANLHSSQGYLGVMSSIYLICSHFGLGRASVLAPIVAFAQFYLFPDLLDDARVLSFLDMLNVSRDEINMIYTQITEESDSESQTEDESDSEDEYGDIDEEIAQGCGLPEDLTLAGMKRLRKISNLHAQGVEKITVDLLIDCLRKPEEIFTGDGVGARVMRFVRAAMGIGLMSSLKQEVNIGGVKMFSIRPDKTATGMSFLATIADVLQAFADYGFACMTQGTFFPKKEMNKLDKFETEVREIKHELSLFELGTLESIGKTRHEFLLRVQTMVVESKALIAKTTDKYTRAGLLVCYETLTKVQTRCTSIFRASELKYCAFGFTIYGMPGVGKSSLVDIMTELFFTWKKVKYGWNPQQAWREFFVTVNLNDPFGSNEMPYHLAACADDIMNKKPEKCALGNTPFDWIIKAINPIPSTILKPDVESKGACTYNYEIVGVTTNKKDLWANQFVTDAFSIHRRVGFYVTPTVKKRFRINNSLGLDTHKTDGTDRYWTFDVEYVVQSADGQTIWLPHLTEDGFEAKGVEIDEMLRIYQREWNKWDDAQQMMLKKKNSKKAVKLCKHNIPSYVCRSCRYGEDLITHLKNGDKTLIPLPVIFNHRKRQRLAQQKKEEGSDGEDMAEPAELNAEALVVPAHIIDAVLKCNELGENPSHEDVMYLLKTRYPNQKDEEWVELTASHIVAKLRTEPEELKDFAAQFVDAYGSLNYLYPDQDDVWCQPTSDGEEDVDQQQSETTPQTSRPSKKKKSSCSAKDTAVAPSSGVRTEIIVDRRTRWQKFKAKYIDRNPDGFIPPEDIQIDVDISCGKTYFEQLDETIALGAGDTWRSWLKYKSACFWSFGFYDENRIQIPWYINMLPDIFKNLDPNILNICVMTSDQIRFDHISVYAVLISQLLLWLYYVVRKQHLIGCIIFSICGLFYVYYVYEKYLYIRSRYHTSRGETLVSRFIHSKLTPSQRQALHYLKYAGMGLAALFVGFKAYNMYRRKDDDRVPQISRGSASAKVAPQETVEVDAEGATYSFTNAKPVWAQVEVTNGEGITPTKYTTDQLISVLNKNQCVAVISSVDGLSSSRCNAVMLGCGLIVFPYHILPEDYVTVTLYVGKSINAGNCITAYISRKDGYNLPEKDLSIQHISQIGDRKILERFLPEKVQTGEHVCRTVYRRLNTGEIESQIAGVRLRPDTFNSQYNDEDKKMIKGYLGEYNRLTERGLCGQLYVAHSKQPFIHSFHVAGKDTIVGSVPILREDFASACEFFKSKPGKLLIAESGEFTPNRDGFTFQLLPTPSRKSPLTFLNADTSFEYYGSIDKPVPRFKSKVKTTLICEDVCKEFDVGLCAKPPPDVPTWKHHHACIENTTKVNAGFPQKFVELAVTDYMKKCGPVFEKRTKGLIKPLTLDETINGVPGIRGLEPMNRKTSAGYPYFKAKNKICEIRDEKMYLTETMISSYLEAVEKWRKGERTYEIFSQSLKDEAVKLTKEVTRTFQCSNLNLTLGLRQYFGPILAALLTDPITFEISIGINAESPEWEALIRSVLKYGEDRVIAGDYKNYDQRCSSQVSMATMYILIALAKLAGYDEDYINIMTTLASELNYPVIYMNGDIFKLFNSTTSGHSLTTVKNCIDNAIYLRMGYYALAAREKLSCLPFYHQVVSANYYGDDNFMSVRPGYDWFNHTALAEFFKEFGMTYTMAIKDQESVPFITINELQYLKRDVYKDEELGAYLAPLDEKSIIKSLQFVCDSEYTPEETAATNVDNALAAYFQHGRSKFEDVQPKLCRIIQKHSLEPFSQYWDKDYDFFKRRWIEKYRTGKYPMVVYPEPPGYKVEDGADVQVYDDKLVRELRNLADACIGQAPEPDSGPLFSGGDAGQKVLMLGH